MQSASCSAAEKLESATEATPEAAKELIRLIMTAFKDLLSTSNSASSFLMQLAPAVYFSKVHANAGILNTSIRVRR